jgi:5-methylcytosine-specific restriction protein A
VLNIKPEQTRKEKIMSPTAWDFQNQLMAILNGARQSGQSYIDVESGKLHQQVGGYANSNHKMPVCCEVMKKMMRFGDSVVSETANGQDSTLTIRYTVQATSTR